MFNPNFDPLAELERLQAETIRLQHSMIEFARAFNHQAEFVKQLTDQLASQDTLVRMCKNRIELLENKIKELEDNGW